MRRGLVIGNWKMHGSRQSVEQLLTGLKAELSVTGSADFAVCPPALYISQVAALLADSSIGWGSQNHSDALEGAYTGEISALMVADVGCRFALVGHSERRTLFAETDEQVAAKFKLALDAGLTPVLCVGERLEQRQAGATLEVIEEQLQAVIASVVASLDANELERAVIAYEPVWAIGTGETATPEQAQEVHAHIRQVIARIDGDSANKVRLLYGGSVKAGNAAELFAKPDIDGALVGGASLKVDEFVAICRAVIE